MKIIAGLTSLVIFSFILSTSVLMAASTGGESIAFLDHAMKRSSLPASAELGRLIQPAYAKEFPNHSFGAILSKNDELKAAIERYLILKKRKVSSEVLLGLREIARQYQQATPQIRILYDSLDNPALLAQLSLEDQSVVYFVDKLAKVFVAKGRDSLLSEFKKEPYLIEDERTFRDIASLADYKICASSIVHYLSFDRSARELMTQARKSLRWGSAEAKIAFHILKHRQKIPAIKAATIEQSAENRPGFQLNYLILIGFGVAFVFVVIVKISQR